MRKQNPLSSGNLLDVEGRRCKPQRITSQSTISKRGMTNIQISCREMDRAMSYTKYDIQAWYVISMEYLEERWFEQYPAYFSKPARGGRERDRRLDKGREGWKMNCCLPSFFRNSLKMKLKQSLSTEGEVLAKRTGKG